MTKNLFVILKFIFKKTVKTLKNYIDLNSEVYYNKCNCEPQKVEIKLPDCYLPKTPIIIWAGIHGDNENNGLTGFVSWEIKNLD